MAFSAKTNGLIFSSILLLQTAAWAEAPRALLGRANATKDAVHLTWPGAGVAYRIKGTQLRLTLEDKGADSLTIVTDGKPSRMDLKAGRHDYVVAKDLSQGEHDVRIYKRTEGRVGSITVLDAKTDGEFLPVALPNRKLLVIGDSISAGYGIEGKGPDCEFTPQTQNHYLTYAAIAARELNADVHSIAQSGSGLVRNSDGSARPTMADFIERTGPTSLAPRIENALKADAVIVHLGTNDFAEGATDKTKGFVAAYGKLLKKLRLENPNSTIYAVMGPMLYGPPREAAEKAVQEAVAAQKAAGDNHIHYLPLTAPDNATFGCHWHPDVKTQAHMANLLITRLRIDMEWK
jgi:lysophospholipase L1-like esterase